MAAKLVKVLIAEDDREICEAYTQAIQEFNSTIQIKIATDGSQAANLVRTERFDGLILDVRLPTMNGLQVGQIARDSELNKKTPIIVISGSLDQESRQRASSLGRVKIMAKPIGSSEFIATLSESVRPEKVARFDAPMIELIRQSVQASLATQVESSLVVAEAMAIQPESAAEIAGLVFLYSVTMGSALATLRLCLPNNAIVAIAKGQQEFEWDDGIVSQILIEIAPQISDAVVQTIAKHAQKAGVPLRCQLIDILYGTGGKILSRARSQVITMPFQLCGQPVHADLVLISAKT